jgi:hypothetical protein
MPVVSGPRTTTADSPLAGDVEHVERRGGAPVLASPGQAVDSDAIRFRVSTEDRNDDGVVVVQSGLEFPDVLPAVADHSHDLQSAIGDWRNVERGQRETFATLRLLPRGVSRAADLVRALHTGGYPLASSVYFTTRRGDVEPIFTTGRDGRPVRTGTRYLRGQVHEISLTQFPMNPAAVAVARSLGFSDAELAALSRPEPAPRVTPSRTTEAVARADASRGTIMTIAEMIAAAQQAHEAAQASLGTATQALESDQSEANLATVARATTEVDALFARLSTLRQAETAAARRAATAPAPAPAPTVVSRTVAPLTTDSRGAPGILTRRTDTKDLPPGTRLAQVVMAASVARSRRLGLDQVATELFADNAEVLAIARAAVGVADATTAGWASELVRYETRAMLDQTINPTAMWPRLAAQGISLNFNGAQSVVVPGLSVGTATGGAWVGEGGVIPLVKGAFTAKRLSRYKLAGIIPITKELQRVSDPSAVDAMTKLLQQFISNLLDSCLIDALPEVPGVRPAGLLNGVTPITGAAGGGYEAFRADLEAITTAFTAAGVGTNPVLLVNTAKAFRLATMVNALGQLVFSDPSKPLNFPIIPSQFVPPTAAIAVAAEKFVSALDTPEIDTSEEATLTMADAGPVAPTQAGDAVGGGALGTPGQVIPDGGIPVAGSAGASTVGAIAISLWQTWSLGVRMVFPASYGLTRPGSVQEVTGITW